MKQIERVCVCVFVWGTETEMESVCSGVSVLQPTAMLTVINEIITRSRYIIKMKRFFLVVCCCCCCCSDAVVADVVVTARFVEYLFVNISRDTAIASHYSCVMSVDFFPLVCVCVCFSVLLWLPLFRCVSVFFFSRLYRFHDQAYLFNALHCV